MNLFDTTFLIDLIHGDEGARELARRIDEQQTLKAISIVTAHEYLKGIHQLFGENGKLLQAKLASAESELRHFEIIPYSYDIATKSAFIESELARSGITIGLADTIIASTALHFNLTLVSRDTEHFKRIPKVKVEEY
jgi:predicted nucleic acid-binding protein